MSQSTFGEALRSSRAQRPAPTLEERIATIEEATLATNAMVCQLVLAFNELVDDVRREGDRREEAAKKAKAEAAAK